MKILILSSMYPNSQLYLSGIFVHEQVKKLAELGLDITVIAPVPYTPPVISLFKERWKRLSNIPLTETVEGIEIIHTKYTAIPKGILKQYWAKSYVSSIEKHLKDFPELSKFDIIHAHGALPNDYAAFLLSERLGIPYVLTVHGDAVYSIVTKPKKFRFSKIAIENAKAVMGVSEKVKERIIRYTDRRENIFVVYNGFNRNTSVQVDKIKENKNLEILFAANLIERKGCEYLVRAFNILQKTNSNIRLTIAGGGLLFQEIRSLVRDLGLNEYVTMTGALNHSQMLNQIAKCDIFVLPSWNEAFGVVYLEAMNFKKPIIGTEGEGISDIVKDGENGLLVKPKNVNHLAEKISSLIEDEEMRRRIGEKGYKTVEWLTWENNAREQKQIYEKVLKSNLHTYN